MGTISTNLILFFLVRSFALIDITAVAPYRYLELIISTIASYFIFGDLPAKTTLCGGLYNNFFNFIYYLFRKQKFINKKICYSLNLLIQRKCKKHSFVEILG
jgi:S-adenosylmethionine uptake transporter